MSYSLMYNWQFLKSEEGITPVVLMGDNNVVTSTWMGNHWGEKRARSWYCIFGYIGVSEEMFMDMIQRHTGGKYQEHWMYKGKWVDDKALVNWGKNACKTAASVEEVLRLNPYANIDAYLSVWQNNKNVRLMKREIRDSASLDAWIREAKQLMQEQQGTGQEFFPIIHYSCENLKRCSVRSKNPPEFVLAKGEYGYLTGYELDDDGNIKRSSWSLSAAEALKMPYDDALDFQTKGLRQRFCDVRLVNAKVQDAPYDAVIRVMSRNAQPVGYVSHVRSGRVHFTFSLSSSTRKYRDIKSAKRTAEKLNTHSRIYVYEAVQL